MQQNLCEPTIRASLVGGTQIIAPLQCDATSIGEDATCLHLVHTQPFVQTGASVAQHCNPNFVGGRVGEIRARIPPDLIRSGTGLSQKRQRAPSGKPQRPVHEPLQAQPHAEHLGSEQ